MLFGVVVATPEASAPGEAGAPRKKEGDESSPAGVFRLFFVFGLAKLKFASSGFLTNR